MLAMIGSVMTAASSRAVLLHDAFERGHIVPGRQHHIVEGRCRNAFRVRNARGILGRTQLFRRMTVRIQEIGIVPAVVVTFELEELCAASVGAGQAQRQHGGFAAGVGEAHDFGGRDHAAQALGSFDFGGSCGREMRALRHRLRNDFDQFGMRMPLDQRAERHHEVDVFVAVDIPHMRALPALEKYRPGRVHGSAARRRVDAFDQRLLGALEPLLRAGSSSGGLCHRSRIT